VERFTLETAGPAAKLRLRADRERFPELCFVTVEVTDAAGRLRPDAEHAVTYTLNGPGSIAGIGSADLSSEANYRANHRRVHHGRALVVLRGREPGRLELRAEAPGLEDAVIGVEVGH
jgi:beta-galactosidase